MVLRLAKLKKCLYRSLSTYGEHFILKTNCDMTNLIKVSDDAVSCAVNLLKEGEVIALPTDTVYGLAANSQSPYAISQLYNIKGRNFTKPIAVCVGSVNDVQTWGNVSTVPPGLLADLLPGPVTIILTRTEHLNPGLNPGIDKVGIRIPDCDFVRKVASSLGVAIALTSANLSGEASTLTPYEFKSLWPKVGAVFDGGKLGINNDDDVRSGSTVVDLTVPGKFSIIREGSALDNTLKILNKYIY